MDRFQEMTIFRAISQTDSLAGAARTLALSEATVSRALGNLERRLGATFAERSTQGIVLTKAGKAFAERCAHILDATISAADSAKGIHGEASGQLILAMPLIMAQQLFLPVLLEYLKAYPKMNLSLRCVETPVNLHEQGIDLAVTLGAQPDSSAFALPLGQVRPLFCATPAYLAKHGTLKSLEQIALHPLVQSRAYSQQLDWRTPELAQLKCRPILSCTTQQGAISAVKEGLGIGRFSSHEVYHELQQGLLVELLAGSTEPARPVYLVYREGRKAAARIRSFIDFVLPLMRAHPAITPQ
ncbi:LysR family transcriptional regulator [Gallaecimonas pentaromativorans]|uniref:DNA-binding transcriptional LysR family regulator n=1 Tax=Gallaecimonas pentaromativorans TaxID=584787 RepID=A0A3N1PBK3_9GAMM|nr:LysR family transcriptional regulator [Gallaecimonas pentaromativorans]ROQ28792.1 DNA-binding transcriptional LysR family regulator [Gallaecimonas pentaromativorans]